MKILVCFCLITACTALPRVFIADTPEVVAEKQRFFQLYNAAAAAAAAAPDIHIFPQNKQHQATHSHVAHRVHSPNTIHRFSAPQPQHHHHSMIHHNQPQAVRWTGPLAATVPAGLPGSVSQVQNTPEVSQAIADFTRAYNAAVVATVGQRPAAHQTAHSSVHHNVVQHSPAHFRSPHAPQPAQPRWTGPLAATVPAGLPGSAHQVADTPEVQQAKANFQAAFRHQLATVLG